MKLEKFPSAACKECFHKHKVCNFCWKLSNILLFHNFSMVSINSELHIMTKKQLNVLVWFLVMSVNRKPNVIKWFGPKETKSRCENILLYVLWKVFWSFIKLAMSYQTLIMWGPTFRTTDSLFWAWMSFFIGESLETAADFFNRKSGSCLSLEGGLSPNAAPECWLLSLRTELTRRRKK